MPPDVDEVVEGELVPELYEPPQPPSTLFQTSDPRTALERMSELARVLVDLVRSQGLAVRINDREHLRVEAWRALGGMVGVHPVTAWSRPNEAGDGYLVRVEARTRAGELVGASEAECSRAERAWASRDAHAIRAMAETRAASRALRGPLGQIVVLAGYEPAGAEEMPTEPARPPEPEPQSWKPTEEQWDEIRALLRTLKEIAPTTDWGKWCIAWGAPSDKLTVGGADILIERLRKKFAELADEKEDPDGAAA